MNSDFDVCIVGSGAGAAPVAYTLAQAGHSVVVLEKGPWFREQDFFKDELACCRRSVYTPDLKDEQHVIEEENGQGGWRATPTAESGWDFWNGNLVGGSSNLMSGFLHRLKPVDFRQRSELGPIAGASGTTEPFGVSQRWPSHRYCWAAGRWIHQPPAGATRASGAAQSLRRTFYSSAR